MHTTTEARRMTGSMTALVTPFRDGEVDWPALNHLIDRQTEAGTDWLVALGTTGETPTLSAKERDAVLEAVIGRAGERCPVMAGTGSYHTADAVERTRRAAGAGAAAALVVTPYYNRPPAEGLFRHFAAIAEAVELPIVLYDVPARTGATIPVEVIVRLRERYPNIVAIKEATGTVDRVSELSYRSDIVVLCGDDALTWPMMSVGAAGVISVIGNLVPGWMRSLVTAARGQDASAALQLHRKVFGFATEIARLGPNPIPIKTAMSVAGLLSEEFRLPLCPLCDDDRRKIEQVMRRYEIREPMAV